MRPSLIERFAGWRAARYSQSTQAPGLHDCFDETVSTRTMPSAYPAGAHHHTSRKVCEPPLAYESSSVIHRDIESSSTTYLKESGVGSEEEISGSEDADLIRLPPKRRVPLTVQVITRRKGRIVNYDYTEIDL
ncbi:MAG: hypothetical protein GX216_11245 [Methanomicrobiales archaeon]|nr:hypothetical protein [Methanomicrobiales archaeon]